MAPRIQVLVVDDSPTVRRQLTLAFERMGVACDAVPSAVAGLERMSAIRYDLVLVDVVMPEVSGGEVSRRIARVLPSAKFLFMSGYSGVEVAAQGVMSEGVHFIQKPFTRQALARKLREALR